MAQLDQGIKISMLQPIMQYGFASMCAVLLGIMVWMMKTNDTRFNDLLEMQKQTNSVIERNTAAIEALSTVVHNKL